MASTLEHTFDPVDVSQDETIDVNSSVNNNDFRKRSSTLALFEEGPKIHVSQDKFKFQRHLSDENSIAPFSENNDKMSKSNPSLISCFSTSTEYLHQVPKPRSCQILNALVFTTGASVLLGNDVSKIANKNTEKPSVDKMRSDVNAEKITDSAKHPKLSRTKMTSQKGDHHYFYVENVDSEYQCNTFDEVDGIENISESATVIHNEICSNSTEQEDEIDNSGNLQRYINSNDLINSSSTHNKSSILSTALSEHKISGVEAFINISLQNDLRIRTYSSINSVGESPEISPDDKCNCDPSKGPESIKRKRKSGMDNFVKPFPACDSRGTNDEPDCKSKVAQTGKEAKKNILRRRFWFSEEKTKDFNIKNYFDLIFGRKISDVSIPDTKRLGVQKLFDKEYTINHLLFNTHLVETFLFVSIENQMTKLYEFMLQVNSCYETEDFLSDLLFSIQSLMGRETNGGTWTINAIDQKPAVQMTQVSLEQVHSYLQEVFQMTPERMDQLTNDVKQRKAADFSLNLKILEAKELRPKTVRGGSNPYVIVSVPNSDQKHRTRIDHETLCPKWNQDFTLSICDLNRDVVNLQVWHDFDPKTSNHVSQVKDLDGFSRLIKGKNAVAHKQSGHLLGSVDLAIKNIREYGIDDWFPLQKLSTKDDKKMRGLLHVAADISAALMENTENGDRRKHFDALLTRIVYHNIKTISNNNKEEEYIPLPWRGQLCPEAKAVLAQHAMIRGLNESLQNLSWWIACSQVATIDTSFQLGLIQKVQSSLAFKSYTPGDIEALAESLYGWIKYSMCKLRHLRTTFPPTSGIIAKVQFTDLIRTFAFIDTHEDIRNLLSERGATDIKSQITSAVTDFVKKWWTDLIEEQLRGVLQPEDQIKRIIFITDQCLSLLNDISIFYGPVLLKDFGLPYFREVYLLLTTKLNACIRPAVMNIYSHLSESRLDLADLNNCDDNISYMLEDGSLLWQLYVNLGRITNLGVTLPLEIRNSSGIYEYYKWFNKGVRHWVEMGRNRAMVMIGKAVDLDNFEPVDEYCNFSSSATDVISIFTSVQIWWRNLAWPDLGNSMVLLAKILEDVCSYSTIYSDLLKLKVEKMFSQQINVHQLVLSKQICTGLNNIERVRKELMNIKDWFGVDRLIDQVGSCSSLGDAIAKRFRLNVDTLIESAAEDMEAKVTEFIEFVIDKMKGTLHHAVINACEASSEKPLLGEVLDPALQVIHVNMTDNNFKRFLIHLWQVLVDIFKLTVTGSADKRMSSYFNGIYRILLATLKFFSPEDGEGLSSEDTQIREYKNLVELLECLRLSSENLIAKYYSDRHDDQLLCSKPTTELIMRAYFTRIGKLTVEVIMAKDIHLCQQHDTHSPKTLYQFDPYIKVQLVPQAWFPNIHEFKTKIVKKCDSAVFEEAFDFELRIEDNGVSQGFLLLTLKNYNLGRNNTFMGEALIPLKELLSVDSGNVHSVPNSYHKVTCPNNDCGHSALAALRMRPGDRVSTAFLKKIGLRIQPELKPPSSDEEKPRSRSPRLLQKMKFGT